MLDVPDTFFPVLSHPAGLRGAGFLRQTRRSLGPSLLRPELLRGRAPAAEWVPLVDRGPT
jgi:hypothetical protein